MKPEFGWFTLGGDSKIHFRKVVFQKFSMDFSDLFVCFFVPLKIRVEKKHVHKQTENSCSTFLWERSHIKIIFPATFKWDNVIVVLEGMLQWIRDISHQPSGLRSQDQWSLCRPPIKALKFQIEVGCSYEVPSLWDPFGLLARPEGRSEGRFFFCEKNTILFCLSKVFFQQRKGIKFVPKFSSFMRSNVYLQKGV